MRPGGAVQVDDPLSKSGPCHCVTDASGRWLLASNYGRGSLCLYPIGPSGALVPPPSATASPHPLPIE